MDVKSLLSRIFSIPVGRVVFHVVVLMMFLCPFHRLVVQLEFSRRKADGSTTMTILNPADPSVGGRSPRRVSRARARRSRDVLSRLSMRRRTEYLLDMDRIFFFVDSFFSMISYQGSHGPGKVLGRNLTPNVVLKSWRSCDVHMFIHAEFEVIYMFLKQKSLVI